MYAAKKANVFRGSTASQPLPIRQAFMIAGTYVGVNPAKNAKLVGSPILTTYIQTIQLNSLIAAPR